MKTNTLNLAEIKELSYEEMLNINGGGWVIDLIEIIDRYYCDFKKGLLDGMYLR